MSKAKPWAPLLVFTAIYAVFAWLAALVVSGAVNEAPGAAWASSTIGRSGEVSASLPAAQTVRIYYIGRWGYANTDGHEYWAPEYTVNRWLDMRPPRLSAMPPSINTTVCCLLAVSDTPIVAAGWTQLGASVNSPISVNTRLIEAALDINPGALTAATVGDLAFELLVEDAEKPLSPNRNLSWSLELDGQRLFNRSVKDEPAAWDNVRKRVETDYTRIRAESLVRGDNLYLKWLADQASRYRVDYRNFIGNNPDEGTVRPETTQTDDFNCGPQAAVGCDLTWTEQLGDHDVENNEARNTANQTSYSRADADVSGDDHVTAAQTGTFVGTAAYTGLTVRHSSSAATFYMCAYRPNSATWTVRIYEVVAGSFTLLISDTLSPAPSTGYNDHECEIDGSDITQTLASSVVLSTTDSTITGNTRGGIVDNGNGSNRARYDDWSITDLAAGAARRVFVTWD